MDQGLREIPLGELVAKLGERLVAGGVPISRIAVGGMILHPIYGAIDVTWDTTNREARIERMPRSVITTESFQKSPFFDALANRIAFKRYRLEDPDLAPDYSILQRFRDDGVTDYLVFDHSFGREDAVLWADLPPGMQGVVCSFSTCRIGGFTDDEIAYLEALTRPLALSVKVRTTNDLARTILDTYLGTYTGGQVLDGLIERGGGKLIDCVLWYADLRNSTALADKLPLDEFLAMSNDYFGCTAGAVIDHGGEVLRYIGDAVMAIFPFEGNTRPAVDMARAASATTREAIARVDRRNAALDRDAPNRIRFGVAMHVGQVMYGNIGTEKRLEFSVTGPAANEVVRLESLCKSLGTPVIASKSFSEIYSGQLVHLGTHPAAGLQRGLDAFTLPELQPRA